MKKPFIYYCTEVLAAVALQQATALGLRMDELLQDATTSALTALQAPDTRSHLAARVAERMVRDQVLSALPDRESVVAWNAAPLTVEIPSPYPNELSRLNTLLSDKDLDGLIARYPVREVVR